MLSHWIVYLWKQLHPSIRRQSKDFSVLQHTGTQLARSPCRIPHHSTWNMHLQYRPWPEKPYLYLDLCNVFQPLWLGPHWFNASLSLESEGTPTLWRSKNQKGGSRALTLMLCKLSRTTWRKLGSRSIHSRSGTYRACCASLRPPQTSSCHLSTSRGHCSWSGHPCRWASHSNPGRKRREETKGLWGTALLK